MTVRIHESPDYLLSARCTIFYVSALCLEIAVTPGPLVMVGLLNRNPSSYEYQKKLRRVMTHKRVIVFYRPLAIRHVANPLAAGLCPPTLQLRSCNKVVMTHSVALKNEHSPIT